MTAAKQESQKTNNEEQEVYSLLAAAVRRHMDLESRADLRTVLRSAREATLDAAGRVAMKMMPAGPEEMNKIRLEYARVVALADIIDIIESNI